VAFVSELASATNVGVAQIIFARCGVAKFSYLWKVVLLFVAGCLENLGEFALPVVLEVDVLQFLSDVLMDVL
jgi:hypothetical protein